MPKKTIELLIRNYYTKIFYYCYYRLYGDYYAAEDCTQEVMFVLYKKINTLDISKDICAWLYSVADKEIKTYHRKKWNPVDPEIIAEYLLENPFESSILDGLNHEDRQLAEEYFFGADKSALAKKNNITLETLYKRISRIRKKLLENKNASKEMEDII